jgi:hypothetical protein
MGLLTKKVAEATVSFGESPGRAFPGASGIPAEVRIERHRQLGGKEPLPMLGSLGAVRLLSMLRREERYVLPFMVLTASLSEHLMAEGMDPSVFAVRDCAPSDIGDFKKKAAEVPGVPEWAPDWSVAAEVDRALPTLVHDLADKPQLTVKLELHEGRNGIGFVKFKFGMSAHPLATVAAWAAVVDQLVRNSTWEEMANPIGGGLKTLGMVWKELGAPNGLELTDAAGAEYHVTDYTARFTPD